MAAPEASQGDDHAKVTKDPPKSTNKPVRRLQSNLEVNRRSNLLSPSTADRPYDPKPQRCRSLSPLSNSTPVLATQRSMITMSNDSFRSPSVLDDIPYNLLRRYPRFSTATTSIETGRPNFSMEELKSTQLSDDEDDIVNDQPKQGSMASRALLKHGIARDVKAMWNSRTSRIRYARERLKTRYHKPMHQSVDQRLSPTDSRNSHVSTAPPDEANNLPVPAPMLDKVTSSPEIDQSESSSATATASASEKDEVIDEERSELGKRVATMIREDIQKEQQASIKRPSLRYAASLSSPQVAEDRLLLGRQSLLAPPRTNPRTQSMATVETIRASAFGQGRYQRRDSLSNSIGRTSQPLSRPSTMRGRQSFSSSVNQPKAQPLFIDTPQDPGTSFIFPSSRTEGHPYDAEENRPVSQTGSIFSVQTATSTPANGSCPQVEFGKAVPQGYQKIPAYTIRRIERSDAYSLVNASLPVLPDSPIAFEQPPNPREKGSGAEQPKENASRASKWSTKVQTNVGELQDQEVLMEDIAEEKKKENFALRGCQKIARALSNRIRSDSLPGRFSSRRWKTGRVETTTRTSTMDNDTLVLGEKQVNVGLEIDREGREQQ